MAEKDNMKVNTSPVSDVETGTAEDVEAIMKKYDRESNTRVWEGVPKQVIRYLLAAFSLLMLYMNLFANSWYSERVLISTSLSTLKRSSVMRPESARRRLSSA